MTSKHSIESFGPTEADILMELSENLDSMSYHQQEYNKKSQRSEIALWKLDVYHYAVPRNIYGPEKRQMLIAMACIRYEREQKRYPLLTLTDLEEVLWYKYNFFFDEESPLKITFGTLETDVRRAHALMNQHNEMLENSRSCIKKAFVILRKAKRLPGKIVFTPLFSLSLQDIEITVCCICG